MAAILPAESVNCIKNRACCKASGGTQIKILKIETKYFRNVFTICDPYTAAVGPLRAYAEIINMEMSMDLLPCAQCTVGYSDYDVFLYINDRVH
jgi:hypothetical protein